MPHAALMETGAGLVSPEQPADPIFKTLAPGITCLELGVGKDDTLTALHLKDRLEQRAEQIRYAQPEQLPRYDYELSFHRLHPAGWKSTEGSSSNDRCIALFTHLDQLPERRQAIEHLRTAYDNRVISDWNELYHHRFFRNNPGVVKWSGEAPVTDEFAKAFVDTLTACPGGAPERQPQAPARRSAGRLARTALVVMLGMAGGLTAPRRPELKPAA